MLTDMGALSVDDFSMDSAQPLSDMMVSRSVKQNPTGGAMNN
jgi:hypothetical protein